MWCFGVFESCGESCDHGGGVGEIFYNSAGIWSEDFVASIGFRGDDEETHGEGFNSDIGKRIVCRRDDQSVGGLIKPSNIGTRAEEFDLFFKR